MTDAPISRFEIRHRRYRDAESVRAHQEQEPLIRLRAYLESQGLWDVTREAELAAACAAEIEAAVQEYLALAPQPPEAMFDSLYACSRSRRAPERLRARPRSRWPRAAGEPPLACGASVRAPPAEP